MRPFENFSRSRAEKRAHLRSVAKFLSMKAALAAVPEPAPPPFPYADIAARVGGPVSVPIGFADDGTLVRAASATSLRHGTIRGGSGAGKSFFIYGQLDLRIRAALGLPTPGLGYVPDDGSRLELLDPKGELAEICYRQLAALWLACNDVQREALADMVRVIDLDASRITPMPLFDREATGLSAPFLSELRVGVEDEGADHRSTVLSRHVRMQFYSVLSYRSFPLSYAFAQRFLTEPAFRTPIMATIPDRDLRLFWASVDRVIPRQTLMAVLRFIRQVLSYADVKLRVGVPPADVRRLLGNRPTPRFTIGCFAAKDLPFARAMEQAKLRMTDACAETVLRDRSIPGQLIADELSMLFHGTNALESVLSLASRTTRSANFGLVLAGQDLSNTVPSSLMETLSTNAIWDVVFRSRPAECEDLYPFVHPSDPAVSGTSERERRKSFLKHVQEMAVRRFYYHVVGVPAIELTSLPVPDPEAATGRSREELVELFKEKVASRSMIRRCDAEEAIEAWEARVVGQLEVPPAAPDPSIAARSMRDGIVDREDLDEDADGPN